LPDKKLEKEDMWPKREPSQTGTFILPLNHVSSQSVDFLQLSACYSLLLVTDPKFIVINISGSQSIRITSNIRAFIGSALLFSVVDMFFP
jgi:hypothetical protein